jgi:chromosomal replication initiator protein
MDDIQFLSNKEKTQEELFISSITSMMTTNRSSFHLISTQITFPNLEERLKSRFGAGMIVDIPHPDQESRAAICESQSEKPEF